MQRVLPIIIFLFIGNLLFSQNKKIDSLKIALRLTKDDTNKVNVLNDLSYQYYSISNYDTALVYANRALIESKKNVFVKGSANTFYNFGMIYYSQQNLPEALNYYFKALKLFEIASDKKKVAKCFGSIGAVFSFEENQDNALYYYEKALKIFQELNDKKSIAINLVNIGNIYTRKKNYQKSLEYYLKSVQIQKELNANITHEYVTVLRNIGIVHSNLKNHAKALDYFFKSLEINEHLDYKQGIIVTQINIGNTYILLKKEKEAEKYLKMAMDNSYKTKDIYCIKETCITLSELYEQQGKWKLSFDYYKKFILFNDSIFSETKSKQIAEMQTKYETKEKTEKINFLKQQDELNQIKIKREQQLKYLILLLCGVIVVSGYFRFRGYKRDQKLVIEKTKIIHENERIKAEKEIIELEQKMLLLQMNPHFIFNSLNSIKSFIVQDKSANALEYLEDFAKLIRLILLTSRKETIKLDDELQLLSYYLKLEQVRMGFSFDFKINLSKDVEENQELFAIPPMFIQPFIENALQHGLNHLNKKGSLIINIGIKHERLQIVIVDNGIGRKKSELINSIERKKHESLAIKIIDERMEAFRLKYNQIITIAVEDLYTYTENTGTKIILNMPMIYNNEQSN